MSPSAAQPGGPLERTAGALDISFRFQNDADQPFLEALYVSTRWEELAHSQWTEAERLTFLKSQFVAQTRHYDQAYRHCSDFLILVKNREPIGRLYLHAAATDLRVIDIALMPQWRGQGIGGQLLKALHTEAAQSGRDVSIHVEMYNPALRLYKRLGFQEVAPNGPYLLMRWPATAEVR